MVRARAAISEIRAAEIIGEDRLVNRDLAAINSTEAAIAPEEGVPQETTSTTDAVVENANKQNNMSLQARKSSLSSRQQEETQTRNQEQPRFFDRG